jgi:dethiobiotin synthetase/adenosylmethionine--8-amino-7-oxononanoate aminotransferase
MLSRHLRTHLVVAPSTSVGKSIFSTGLVRASLALGEKVGYLKPVGTGSGDGDDELCVTLRPLLPF